MNDPTVWEKFCDTYEALYDLFGKFDAWYLANGQGLTVPSLQAEWKEYIRIVLDSASLRTQAHFDVLFSRRRYAITLAVLFYQPLSFANNYYPWL